MYKFAQFRTEFSPECALSKLANKLIVANVGAAGESRLTIAILLQGDNRHDAL